MGIIKLMIEWKNSRPTTFSMNDIQGLKVAPINYDMRTFFLFMRTMLSTLSDLKTVGSIIQTIFIKPEEQDISVYGRASQMKVWSRREVEAGLYTPERGY